MAEVLLVGDGWTDRLSASLARERPAWSVSKTNDAAAALDRLRLRPVDIVVGGAGTGLPPAEELMRSVADIAPLAMRFVLFPSDQPCFDKVSHAHQVLAARDDIDYLLPILSAAAAVSEKAAQNRELQRIISHLHDVPSPPSLYFDLREQTDALTGDLQRMAEITAKDPGLVARILRIANSGFYGVPRSVSDLSEAVGLIGTEALLGMVLAAHLYAGLPPPGLKLEVLWQHTARVSTLARHITRLEGGDRTQQSVSSVAGLLHDIGMLVLLENEPARYQPLWRQSAGDEQVLAELESATFGVTHGELGALILMLWSLPDAVVQAVADSHATVALENLPLTSRAVLAAEWLLDRSRQDSMPRELAAVPDATLALWRLARDEVALQTTVM